MKSTTIPQILLTGSSGYLGQHVLHSLLTDPLILDTGSDPSSYHIHAMYGGSTAGFPHAVEAVVAPITTKSNTNDNDHLQLPQVTVQVHALDWTNADNVHTWTSQHTVTVCVHMGAMSSPATCQAQPDLARAVNVPTHFFQALQKRGIPIIALSTDQVYDGTQAPYREDDGAVNPVNVYGQTKLEMEQALLSCSYGNKNDDKGSTESPLTVVILRSSIILGPLAPINEQAAHATFLHFCQSRDQQETTFYTDECRTVIAVDNVVDVIRSFLSKLLQQSTGEKERVLTGIYNMGGPQRVSRMDMAHAVFRHFGYNENCLVDAEKASLPPQGVASPLDISMDSRKLYQLMDKITNSSNIRWKNLADMVQVTFGEQKNT